MDEINIKNNEINSPCEKDENLNAMLNNLKIEYIAERKHSNNQDNMKNESISSGNNEYKSDDWARRVSNAEKDKFRKNDSINSSFKDDESENSSEYEDTEEKKDSESVNTNEFKKNFEANKTGNDIVRKKKKDPTNIPKKGYFFEHDSREHEESLKEENGDIAADKIPSMKTPDDDLKATKAKNKITNNTAKKNNIRRKNFNVVDQSIDTNERWQHDRFDQEQQKPKSRSELIKRYGYDIRDQNEFFTKNSQINDTKAVKTEKDYKKSQQNFKNIPKNFENQSNNTRSINTGFNNNKPTNLPSYNKNKNINFEKPKNYNENNINQTNMDETKFAKVKNKVFNQDYDGRRIRSGHNHNNSYYQRNEKPMNGYRNNAKNFNVNQIETSNNKTIQELEPTNITSQTFVPTYATFKLKSNNEIHPEDSTLNSDKLSNNNEVPKRYSTIRNQKPAPNIYDQHQPFVHIKSMPLNPPFIVNQNLNHINNSNTNNNNNNNNNTNYSQQHQFVYQHNNFQQANNSYNFEANHHNPPHSMPPIPVNPQLSLVNLNPQQPNSYYYMQPPNINYGTQDYSYASIQSNPIYYPANNHNQIIVSQRQSKAIPIVNPQHQRY